MNEKHNTIKNVGFATASFAIGLAAKFFFGNDNGNLIANVLSGISGSITATELDRIKINFMKLLEFKGKHPNALNHDLMNLSEAALNLSISEGIKIQYKEELKKQNKLTSELNNEIDSELKKLQDASKDWKFSDTDVIKFVDFKYDYSENPLEILISELVLPEIHESLPFNTYFKDHFAEVYQLYFGELLKKPEFGKALIAYQRQVQDLMMEAIRQEKKGLTKEDIEKISENISKLSSGDITNAIDDVNKSLQNINIRLDEIIEKYLKTKTLKIEALRGDYIECSEGLKIPTVLEEFKKKTEDYLFFKYRGFSHTIDDLTEEDFDYFTKKIKVNHILIPDMIASIRDYCERWDTERIYDRIESQKDWIKKDRALLNDCREFIIKNLLGVISPYIGNLFEIGQSLDENEQEPKNRREYISKCYWIVKQIIDLSIFVLLTYLWEDKITTNNDIRKEINNFLENWTSLTDRINLLTQLINFHSTLPAKKGNNLLEKLIGLKDNFNENGNLSISCKELDKLTDISDLNPFDCYRAEKILTEVLEHFAFLSNYNMISIKEIEYHNIKNCTPAYIHYRRPIDFSKEGIEKIDNNASAEPSFTDALLLTNRMNNEYCINLYPFIIDRNALKSSKSLIPTLAFLEYCKENILHYEVLRYNHNKEDDPYTKLKRKEISDKEDKYSKSNIEQYNINCLLESFGEIKKILTNN